MFTYWLLTYFCLFTDFQHIQIKSEKFYSPRNIYMGYA